MLANVVNLFYPVALHILPVVCLLPDDPIRAHIISLALVMSAIATLLQCYVGIKCVDLNISKNLVGFS